MLKGIKILALIIVAIVTLTGCVNFLEGSTESISEHQAAPYIRPPTEQISVSSYEELIETLLELITEHETNAQLLYYPHEGEDVQAELIRAANEIMYEHPIGVYSVAILTTEATRIVSHFEVDVEIEFIRSKEQLDSIINASSERYIRAQMLNIMSDYREEAVIRTNLQITEEDIATIVTDTYYQNPRRIVMLPAVTVEIFPPEGADRIFEINFGNTQSPGMMQRFGDDLELYVQRNAELAVGDTEPEILLYLANNLMSSTVFDEGVARTTQRHGAQNFAATAFGALVRGNAIGEGFAMAFKALCDELGITCRIVLGQYDGMVHAWNIVELYGSFYHIDVAMSLVNGIETAFLKTDVDFDEMYTWDRENTVRCEGELTLEDILGPGEVDIPEDLEDANGEQNDNEEESV